MIPWYAYLGLLALGLVLGMQVNRAIYDWAWFVERTPSPLGRKKRLGEVSAWRWVPVVGWWSTRSLAGETLYPSSLAAVAEADRGSIPLWTTRSWWRPACVELTCGLGLPLLAWFYASGAWVGVGWSLAGVSGGTTTVWVWIALHAVLLGLMLIAALIDWDEQTIPDQVTTTGVVLALLVLFFWPAARLPNVEFSGLVATIDSMHVFSPQGFPASQVVSVAGTDPTDQTDRTPLNGAASSIDSGQIQGPQLPGLMGWITWEQVAVILDPRGRAGLWTACGCWLFWTVLVLPSLVTLRFGWRRAVWLAWVSVFRPARRPAGLATRVRRTEPMTWVTLGVGAVACGLCVVAWNGGDERWEAVYSLSVSMALAGLGTWLVRLLAGWVMGREALGFGDVTLMFMIGAAFGWQFALLVFAIAPILAIGYALFRAMTAGEQALALGPWLVAAAVLVLLGWSTVWHDLSRQSVFGMGPFLLVVLGMCLTLMPVALILLVIGKRWLGLDQDEPQARAGNG